MGLAVAAGNSQTLGDSRQHTAEFYKKAETARTSRSRVARSRQPTSGVQSLVVSMR